MIKYYTHTNLPKEKIITQRPLDKLKKHANALENIKYGGTKQTFLKLIVYICKRVVYARSAIHWKYSIIFK
ncbi:hypothetical protein HMPREF1640_01050 [Prevotella sp. S7-1-8]|nr:hypothetical protein HMPREF1640_01050 [Prevotella sp. S7-1-8]